MTLVILLSGAGEGGRADSRTRGDLECLEIAAGEAGTASKEGLFQTYF